MPVSDWLVQPLKMERGQGTEHLGWGLKLLWFDGPVPSILPIPEALILDSPLDGFHSIQCPGRRVILTAVARERRKEVEEAGRERLTGFPRTQKAVLCSGILLM